MIKKRPDPALIQQALQEAQRLIHIGHAAEAEPIYREVLKVSSTHTEALHGLAQLLYQQNRSAEALVIYDRLRVMLPRHSEILSDRANTLDKLGRSADALADYNKALEISPDHVTSLYNRGHTLLELGRLPEALASFDRALSVQPRLYQAHSNRAATLGRMMRFAEAIASFDTALALAPHDAEIATNRAATLHDLGRDLDALAAFEASKTLAPLSALARYNMSFAMLRQGDFTAGWAAYESRWDLEFFLPNRPRFDVPLWLGQESIAGQTLLLYAEQGIGDAIQFIRYVPQIAALGAKLVVQVPESIIGLMTDLAGDAIIVAPNQPLPAHDFHCPLMSLPHALRTTLDTIPVPISYMSPPADKAENWRQRLHAAPGIRVGLVWSGRPDHRKDAQRSIPLPMLDPILAASGVSFFSLQKDPRPTDAIALSERQQIVPLGNDFHSFADTAAAIAALDLVITVDTSVAHLAGAMGKPVWILLPYAPDFRWLMDRTDSPWYPTARLFRQHKTDDWSGVIAAVTAALAEHG